MNRTQKILFCFLALALILIARMVFTSAPTTDLTVSRAVLEDKTGSLTIHDVVKRPFIPYGFIFSRSIADSAYWIRLTVRKPAAGGRVCLFNFTPFLNELRLYEPDATVPGGWKTRATGSLHPFGTRDRLTSSLSFIVEPQAPESVYYLRASSKTVMTLILSAFTPEEADRKDREIDLYEVFWVTTLLCLLVWAILSYLQEQLPVVGLFALYLAMFILSGLDFSGYLAPIIPVGNPALREWFSAMLFLARSATMLLFFRELFRPYHPPAKLLHGFTLALYIFPLILVAKAAGYHNAGFNLAVLISQLIPLYCVVVAFSLRTEQIPSRRSLQIICVAMSLGGVAWLFNSHFAKTNAHVLIHPTKVGTVNAILVAVIFAAILNSRVRSLVKEAQQTARELQAKSDFLALVSHEIRTPLNAIVGFSAMARESRDSARTAQYLTILEQSSQSLMELVNDMLDLSKIKSGQLGFEILPLNLSQLVRQVEEEYRPLAEGKGLTFRLELAPGLPDWVLGDSLRLRQILANLLSNAVKFTEAGEVSCCVTRGEPADKALSPIRFEVRDTGIGIPEGQLSRLFEPFRQYDSSISRRFGGTGLGLSIVRSLVTLMHGDVTVQSRLGIGSSFTVFLPLQETDPAPERIQSPDVPHGSDVLVVEDNRFNRKLLEDLLTNWGQRVTLAEDGQQALNILEQRRFDIVLLDIRMAGISGIEVARRFRERERELSLPPTPIIAITAEANTGVRDSCLEAGINAVLTKPVVPEKLAIAIAEHCGKTMATSEKQELLLNSMITRDLGNDPERTRKFRDMLSQDIEDELLCLEDALERDDRSELSRAAHTLKGLCGSLENRQPVELAAWLQHNAPTASSGELRQAAGQLRTVITGE